MQFSTLSSVLHFFLQSEISILMQNVRIQKKKIVESRHSHYNDNVNLKYLLEIKLEGKKYFSVEKQILNTKSF